MPARTTNEFLDGNKHAPSEKERNGRKVLDKDSPFTLWSFENKQKWFIDEDDLDEFYKLYCADVRNGVPLFLTEKMTAVGMLRVDLDFKYEGDVSEHKHTQAQVISFVKAYMEEVRKYIQVPEDVEVFILEKDYPTYDKAKNVSNSGIHMHIPSIKTRSSIETTIRRNLIRRMPEFFPGLEFAKGKTWDDVYDKSPLSHNNNWPMLGSKKPAEGSLPYRIRYILDWEAESGDISVDTNVPTVITPALLRQHSVRSRDSEMTPLTEKGEKDTAPVAERSHSVGRGGRPAVMPGKNASRGSSPGRNYIEPLSAELKKYYHDHLFNLSSVYYTDYKAWTDVGICLKNIHPDLEDEWLEFSHQYEKYNQSESIAKWMSFGSRNDGEKLTKASLLYWSRESNFERFQEIERNNVDRLVDTAANTMREFDVAEIIHAKYRGEFVCSNYEKSDWYQFVGHVWKNISRGVPLLARLSGEIAKLFLKKADEESKNIQNSDPCPHTPKEPDPTCEVCRSRQNMKKYNNMYIKLGQTGFKDSVMKECKLLFFDGDFENKLNNNKTLLAFNNGIYDLQNHDFRQGQPEDYISKCTNLDYNITMTHQEYDCWPELEKFLKSILPRESVRTYFLRHVASCLAGAEGSQKFHIMTGSGSNGKSLFTNLIVKSFGTYATKVPVSLMTQKRNKSSAANPEIMKMRGCRFGSMAEPDEGEALSTGLLKELSGGESMTSRDLYAGSKDMQDFVLQIRLHLACNEKPKVTTNDGGTWRRLVVIDFPSKFVAKPNPANKNELPMDETIDFKVNTPEWAECFMSMLVSIYKEGNGWRKMDPPKEVMEYTNEYHEESDAIAKFMNEYIHTDAETPGEPPEPVSKPRVTDTFREWKRSNEVLKGNVDELMKRIEAQFGKYPRGGWTNFRLGSN